MDSQLFYLFNFAFAAIFAIWFFKGRQGDARRPTSLNLKAKSNASASKGVLQADKSSAVSNLNSTVPAAKAETKSPSELRDVTGTAQTAEKVIKEKKKTALFMYNGHDWDAFEVLGVGSGAALPEITKQYQALIKKSDQAQVDFLECAYKTILRKF